MELRAIPHTDLRVSPLCLGTMTFGTPVAEADAIRLIESIQTFDGLAASGKIRHWGISNFPAAQIADLLKLCDDNGWRRPVALQHA